jgi:predicted PurR-regulated permease PerM
MHTPSPHALTKDYLQRLLATIALVALAALIGWLVVSGAQVLLMAFGGLLFGIFLHGLSRKLSTKTPLPYPVALGIVAVFVTAALVGAFYVMGPYVADQFDQFSVRLPQSWEGVETWLRQYDWGVALLEVREAGGSSSGDALSSLAERASGVVQAALSGVMDSLLILILGLFVAATPRVYARGIVWLVPPTGRERAWDVLRAVRFALARWIMGRMASMILVGLLTWGGLKLLGLPLALSLALAAALLSFIPNLGPLLSVIPAALVGLSVSPQMALYVVLMYAGIQLIESNLLTPLIQRRAVLMPPALLLTGQVLMGTIFGAIGIIFATPLIVTVIVLVQLLYLRQNLGDDIDLMGHAERVLEGEE